VTWITDDWKLKLLAFGLAVLMLGALAFSQNPPTSKTLQVGIAYTVPSGLILLNPPKTTTVTVTGLADLVSAANSGNTAATADVRDASPGPSVKVNLVGKTLIPGVTVQATPIGLNVDTENVVQLAVVARLNVPPAPGWQVTKLEAQCSGPPPPCTLTFDGPASWQKNLRAFADYPIKVESDSYTFPSAKVVLEQNGTTLDWTRYTLPQTKLDITSVSIVIQAKSGTSSRQVTLVDSQPSNPPPNCYRVTGITVDPISIVVIGTPDALSGITTTLALPAVDLSQKTSNASFQIAIPFPPGVTGSQAKAKVTYSISNNPNCSTPSP
jgi:YbbR domain-containing protein